MYNTISTISDAVRIVSDWTEGYVKRPSEGQIRSAAIELVDHIGGYGNDLTTELSESFDLDSVLYE